jgi:hypothetical protein
MDFKLTISGQGGFIDATALCEGTITWTTERRGSPGKLSFTLLRHEELTFSEGDAVSLTVDGVPLFAGYIFKNERDKNKLVPITAYDQMRYLKNKDVYIYQDKTAADVLRMVAGDYGLACGSVADTGYVIPARCEADAQSLMDIVYTAMDLTLIHTGQLFVLYDDFGQLALKNIRDMKVDAFVSTRGGIIDWTPGSQ